MILLVLLWQFSLLSLVAVGGANVLIPELQRLVMEQGWMSGREFAALFAIAQAAPGPNVLVVCLIGWQVAGVPGALVSMVGICGPSSVLSFYVARWWQRYQQAPLTRAIQRGLAPLTIGLVAASACLLSQAANASVGAWLLCGAVALAAWRTTLNPLWLLSAGALLGGLGLL
ncbi:chromate transporter [Chromobacterium haemolyticum]|uniref:chromate transporter n=1 Tax=Chromobacterium TaxID=535 RepID=UPI0005B85BDF|nr:chromate transporter [Chromobacterium haemolyticum]UGA39042.1 chromate transporter [Chromobacterium haemolyticum]